MATTDRALGWGVVSTGTVAHNVTADLALLENSRVAAVSSRDKDRAEAFAAACGIDRAHDSVPALIDDPTVDIVYIATPHAQHPLIVEMALDAGKPVLCEKAFTTSLDDTIALVELARQRKVFCMEAMWTRFNPLMVRLRRMVADGAIGEIRSISAELGFVAPVDPRHRLWDPEQGGGALLDVGIYPIAFAQMLMGAPDGIMVHGTLTDQGVDAEVGIMTTWSGGARGHLEASLVSPVAGAASVLGTIGRIEIDPRFQNATTMRHVRAPRRGSAEVEVHEIEREGLGYVPMLRAVAQAVREERTECPEMPLADTVDIMTIIGSAHTALGVTYPTPAPII